MPIPPLPLFRHRDTVVTPADQNLFVTQFETTMDTMSNNVIPAMNDAITDINGKVVTATTARDEAEDARDISVSARNEAVTAVATLQAGAIDDTTIAPNKAFSNQYIQSNYYDKTETYNKIEVDTAISDATLNINALPDKPTPEDTDNFALQEVGGDLKKVSFLNIQNVLQVVYAENKVSGSGSLTIPADGTIPQITEGNQILTCLITPKKANSRLLIEFSSSCQEVTNTSSVLTVACFRNGVANALYQTATQSASSGDVTTDNGLTGRFIINTPSTNALTFSLRAGLNSGSTRWNQVKHVSETMNTQTTMTITEIIQ